MKTYHKKRIFLGLVTVFLLSALASNGQKVLIRGSAEKLIDDARLMKQYEFEVLQYAINNALYDEFGSSVASNYETLSETSMEGRSVVSHSDLRSNYSSSFPNGVWLSHKEDPVFTTYKDEKSNWWLKCEVVGMAEPVTLQAVEFVAKTLDGTDPVKDQSLSFVSGESGYLYFRSAESGYIVVYYDDFVNVQRCFPYNEMELTLFPIKANTDYILFDRSSADYIGKDYLVDEIEFYTEKDLEFNLFYIIYSNEAFTTPLLNNEQELEDDYKSFKSMPREDFQRWLQRNRIKNDKLQVEVIGITIRAANK